MRLILLYLLVLSAITFPTFHARNSPRSTNAETLTAKALLDKGIAALGGYDALQALKGVSSHAYLYRSATLEESVTPGYPDNTIATAGTQTISYNLSGDFDEIVQRIDRAYTISEYWYFGRPQLAPMNISLVTRSGAQGYSCYVRGNEGIYSAPDYPNGYTDPALANVLLRDATRLYPKLLLGFSITPELELLNVTSNGIEYPALRDTYLNMTVLFDPDTHLPHIIRVYEDHHIFGNSTSDFVVYNYTTVAGVRFPRRFKLMYNEDNLLIDFLVDNVNVNPSFAPGFFDGLPENRINNTVLQIPPVPAMASAVYGDAEVFENSQNLLWYGGYLGSLENLTVSYPVPKLPGLIHLRFNDAPGYTTTVANMEDAVMVTDAPPHQSKLVIQWVKEHLNKSVTHLLVTHHHHDHNYGAADFVGQGAKLVVPEPYTSYWENIPGVQFATSSVGNPFVHRSPSMQVRGVWPGEKNVHALDWQYFTFTPACPNNTSPFSVEVADAWSPGAVGYEFNQFLAIEYLAIARAHRIPRNHLVIPIHGFPSPAEELYNLTGYDYPDFQVEDFLPGGPWC